MRIGDDQGHDMSRQARRMALRHQAGERLSLRHGFEIARVLQKGQLAALRALDGREPGNDELAPGLGCMSPHERRDLGKGQDRSWLEE